MSVRPYAFEVNPAVTVIHSTQLSELYYDSLPEGWYVLVMPYQDDDFVVDSMGVSWDLTPKEN